MNLGTHPELSEAVSRIAAKVIMDGEPDRWIRRDIDEETMETDPGRAEVQSLLRLMNAFVRRVLLDAGLDDAEDEVRRYTLPGRGKRTLREIAEALSYEREITEAQNPELLLATWVGTEPFRESVERALSRYVRPPTEIDREFVDETRHLVLSIARDAVVCSTILRARTALTLPPENAQLFADADRILEDPCGPHEAISVIPERDRSVIQRAAELRYRELRLEEEGIKRWNPTHIPATRFHHIAGVAVTARRPSGRATSEWLAKELSGIISNCAVIENVCGRYTGAAVRIGTHWGLETIVDGSARRVLVTIPLEDVEHVRPEDPAAGRGAISVLGKRPGPDRRTEVWIRLTTDGTLVMQTGLVIIEADTETRWSKFNPDYNLGQSMYRRSEYSPPRTRVIHSKHPSLRLLMEQTMDLPEADVTITEPAEFQEYATQI